MSDPLAPYPSPEARERELAGLAERVQGRLVQYGTSSDGAPLQAVQVPGLGPTTQRVLCSANIHGIEFVSGRVAIALLEALAANQTFATALRQQAEIWVAPCLNPDGYRRTWDRNGDAPLSHLRPNANGVDLNRNFPRPTGEHATRLPGAGSSRPGDATYRGPHPLSESESRSLDELLTAHPMRASVNLHSFMGTIIPARVTERPSFHHYVGLCREFTRAQVRSRYWRLSSRWCDVFTGELEDHQHHRHGIWAACVETFPVSASFRQYVRPPSLFWRFNPRDPSPWIENDLVAVVAFLRAALALPRPTDLLPDPQRA